MLGLRTDTVIRKTMAKPSVTDGRSHDNKLFVAMKVLGGLDTSGDSDCPQDNLPQLGHDDVDHIMALSERHCRHPRGPRNMTKKFALLFAAH